jgi:hypothetical protein
MRRSLVVLVSVVALVGCSGDDDAAPSNPTSADRPVADTSCAEIYRVGATLPDGVEDRSCLDEAGDEVTFVTVTYDCEDGDTLVGNQLEVSWLASDRVVLDVGLMADPQQADITAACSGP